MGVWVPSLKPMGYPLGRRGGHARHCNEISFFRKSLPCYPPGSSSIYIYNIMLIPNPTPPVPASVCHHRTAVWHTNRPTRRYRIEWNRSVSQSHPTHPPLTGAGLPTRLSPVQNIFSNGTRWRGDDTVSQSHPTRHQADAGRSLPRPQFPASVPYRYGTVPLRERHGTSPTDCKDL